MSHRHDHPADGADAPAFDEAYWNERYASSTALWSGKPNPQLLSEANQITPGTALDVGCGEGADAVWLAEHGWRVTATDLSSVALARAAAHALERGRDIAGRITWTHVDLTEWVPPAAEYDLVSAQFMHLPRDQRDVLFGRLVDAVAPGGTLLIVGHDPSDMQTTAPRPRKADLYFTASDVAASLPVRDWVVVVEEARARSTVDPDGLTITIHDAVLRAERKS